MGKNERKWWENYRQLKEYVLLHQQLPDKKKVDNRGLLNWWKYNIRLIRKGKMDGERTRLLKELSELRTSHELFANEMG